MRLKYAAGQSIVGVGSQNDPPQWTDVFVMNQRVSPPGTAKGRRAWLFLSLLLPALASKVSTQATSLPLPGPAPLVPEQSDRPYLALVGPPPLRFEDLLPPPDLSTHPAAGAPPKVSEAEETVAKAVMKAASIASAPTRPTTAKAAPAASAAKVPTVAPILSDDVPAQVRPEDFLPYFQFPGSSGGADSAPTAPRSIPPSSATYTQQ